MLTRILASIVAFGIIFTLATGFVRAWVKIHGGQPAWEEFKKEMGQVFGWSFLIAIPFTLAFLLLVYAMQGHL